MDIEFPKSENVLTEELLKLQANLEGISEIYKWVSEAKNSLESATASLTIRADDQWGATQEQMTVLSDAISAIQQSAKSSDRLTGSLSQLASNIDSVNFPARLSAIETFTAEQAIQVGSIATICTDLQDLSKSASVGFDKLSEKVTISGQEVAARVGQAEIRLNEVCVHVHDLGGKVESIHAAILTVATSISTLQMQLFRELDSFRKAVQQAEAASRSGHEGSHQRLSDVKNKTSLIGIGILANTILIGLVLWKVWI